MSNKKNAHQMDTDKPQPKREREVVEEDEEEEEEEGEQVSKVALAQEHLKDLPQVVRKRVKALENLQKAHSDIDRQYRDELDALERKYMALHAPLLQRRAGIVNGEIEPSEQDAAGYIADATAPTTDAKGVPLFWYHALCNNEAIRSLTGLNERDKEALAALRDISYTLLPRTRKTVEDKEITEHGFSLTFTFGENEFFSDATLTKTYHLTEDETGEPMFDRAEANKPQWKTGKNLTMRVIKKAVPRPKRGGKRATGAPQFQTVEEPCESFFQFFSPVQMPDPGAEMDPDEFDELTEAVQGDFEAGCEIRDAICPRAVAWFNGTAVEDDDDEDDWDEDEDLEDEEGDEDDEDEDDEDDEEEDERPKGKKGQAAGHKFAAPPGSNPAENPECKQQ